MNSSPYLLDNRSKPHRTFVSIQKECKSNDLKDQFDSSSIQNYKAVKQQHQTPQIENVSFPGQEINYEAKAVENQIQIAQNNLLLDKYIKNSQSINNKLMKDLKKATDQKKYYIKIIAQKCQLENQLKNKIQVLTKENQKIKDQQSKIDLLQDMLTEYNQKLLQQQIKIRSLQRQYKKPNQKLNEKSFTKSGVPPPYQQPLSQNSAINLSANSHQSQAKQSFE